ncbi:cation transport ATPase [Flavobacterium limnosediminis JC2902]|uniref:Cation transport ATPase n=1 Tax=Flavobacterium limnosediminis JC2902 TaxID=1341181 RepID=V6SQQ6_9FLAO|nr:cation-translocating P-type ATPase [Flavobacterium limnosediminis]ESU28779.1 cation transport ATPase [Flavobacterium limnosediminis JC2902]
MSDKINIPEHLTGLNDNEVAASRKQFGSNEQLNKPQYHWWRALFELLKEPMLILLVAISVIYFILGQNSEAWFMLSAVIAVSGISFYQDNRSRKALEALEALNEPLTTVLRKGKKISIPTKEIVINDLVIAEEGNLINADGEIVHSNDFSVNESSLTGEAYSVFKSEKTEDKKVFSGTLVASGLAVFRVTEIGSGTVLGKLGSSLINIKEEATPLQQQIERFVKKMAYAGIAVFVLVWAVYFWKTNDILHSLLKGLTLAMSILPEEIPVAFTTFMALGSWRLMQEGIIVKKTRTVETLGSATVICTDKTGTLTENKMSLQAVYAFANNQLSKEGNWNDPEIRKVITTAMWASEPVPFDPMEKTLHQEYEKITPVDERTSFKMFHEYPLDGKPPMMTHLFQNKEGKRIIAAKGATEALLTISNLNETQRNQILHVSDSLASNGFRILGVGYSDFEGNDFPETQQELPFHFVGLIAFFDPPKANIHKVIQQFYDAGIKVKVVTGDNNITTKAIAEKAGIAEAEKFVNGADLMQLNNSELIHVINKTTLLTRMFPEAKLSIVNALKNDNQIVAMVGDGVNDGPALKASHIGVAMGQKGTEIAKSAADLILIDDDLSKMIVAVATGRRIYTNIKKAVQYIVSIHIPIILTVSLPLFLGWQYPDIFTPVHVIFLELVMGPMCSIVYENEPIEKNSMQLPPRALRSTFLSFREMSTSILQGLAITIGILFMYQFSAQTYASEQLTRTMVFTTLVFANIILSLANRSFLYSIFTTLEYKNNIMLALNSATLSLLALILYLPVTADFFKVEPLSVSQLGICLLVSSVSVLWIEILKWKRRKRLLK